MKKTVVHTKTIVALAMALLLTATVSGCGRRDQAAETPGPVLTAAPVDTAAPVSPTEPAEAPGVVIDSRADGALSDEELISAIKRYCFIGNPDLESMVNAGEYPVYWEIVSSDERKAVVLFRSYTGAQIRYYIDRVSGDTYVTEFVPGISSGEERTDESFNVRDYLSGSGDFPDNLPSIPGTWQTASMAYEADGTIYPEYHVRFTASEIVYGHWKDGEFVSDHSDPIALLEETSAGGYKVQAESSNGVRYTYQTSESDDAVLEYFESWNEADFPETYRGGASLSRCG